MCQRFLSFAILTFTLIIENPFGTVRTAVAQSPKDDHMSVWNGVYTTAQAQRGNVSYLEKCAGCHKDDLSGYQGVLKSENFMQHWGEDSLQSLFTTIKTTMPRSAPASLSDGVYIDILTFILQANDFPAGAHDLTVAVLPNIQVEDKSGKLELPSGALIDVVGCLTQSSDGSWMLSFASEPVRTRNPNDSTAEQLKSWEAKPLGRRQFALMDVAAYHPDSQKDRKVEAKGLIIKNPNADRINLTALQMVDSKCGQ
jgi:hypothetical protein